jgi:hypothetical protein
MVGESKIKLLYIPDGQLDLLVDKFENDSGSGYYEIYIKCPYTTDHCTINCALMTLWCPTDIEIDKTILGLVCRATPRPAVIGYLDSTDLDNSILQMFGRGSELEKLRHIPLDAQRPRKNNGNTENGD